MASELMQVCSVFDVVAGEHGPLFFAKNPGLMWRNVDALVKSAPNINPADFVVCVHAGEFDVRDVRGFVSVGEPRFYSVSREPVSLRQVEEMVVASQRQEGF